MINCYIKDLPLISIVLSISQLRVSLAAQNQPNLYLLKEGCLIVQAVSRSHRRRCLKREGCLMVHQTATQSRPRHCLLKEGC